MELFLSKLVNQRNHCPVNVAPIEERRIIGEDLERAFGNPLRPLVCCHITSGQFLEFCSSRTISEVKHDIPVHFRVEGCTHKHLAFSANDLRMLMMTTFLRDRAAFRKVARI